MWGFGSPFHETFHSASTCKLEVMPWQPIIVYKSRTGNAKCIVSERESNFNFSNHAICNIFGLKYHKLLGLLKVAIQIFQRSNLDSVFSKVFIETEGKI